MNVIIQGKGTGYVQDKMNCQVTDVKECVTSSCKVDLRPRVTIHAAVIGRGELLAHAHTASVRQSGEQIYLCTLLS